ncbi:MAG: hypothetical protein PF505_00320 [Vallitaleaceae bacterium]|nr:hypothetical protein [Vallitaleaceae bacterium]
MKDVATGQVLSYEDYLLYQDYELAIFDLIGNGYTSSFYIPGQVIAIGASNSELNPVVNEGVISVTNKGENDIAIVVYQLDGNASDIKFVERDHLYYELNSLGALERFTTYIKEDDLFYLGEGVTLREMIDYFYDGDYAAFYEETPLSYFKDERTVTLDELMQDIDVNVDVFTSENVSTYIRVPGELVFISQDVSYQLDGDYIYIGPEYSGEIVVGYRVDNK